MQQSCSSDSRGHLSWTLIKLTRRPTFLLAHHCTSHCTLIMDCAPDPTVGHLSSERASCRPAAIGFTLARRIQCKNNQGKSPKTDLYVMKKVKKVVHHTFPLENTADHFYDCPKLTSPQNLCSLDSPWHGNEIRDAEEMEINSPETPHELPGVIGILLRSQEWKWRWNRQMTNKRQMI